MMTLEVTITATRRPEVLERTLKSFKPFWTKLPDRTYINVDPVGHDIDPQEVVEVATKYLGWVAWRTPEKAGFGDAFKWCWMQTRGKYVFHLEEDWELLVEASSAELIRIMDSRPHLALLRLPISPSGTEFMKNWSHYYKWNGVYYECPQERRAELGFCGHPSMIRGDFVRACAKHLNPNRNPEKQFHRGPLEIIRTVLQYNYGVYGKPGMGPYIRDIGRHWMVENGWAKEGVKSHFTMWQKTSKST